MPKKQVVKKDVVIMCVDKELLTKQLDALLGWIGEGKLFFVENAMDAAVELDRVEDLCKVIEDLGKAIKDRKQMSEGCRQSN